METSATAQAVKPTTVYFSLRERWRALWQRMGAQGIADSAFERLAALYRDATRAYHNLEHLDRCFAEFNEIRHLLKDPDAVEMAIFFHDAFHAPAPIDCERTSACLAEHDLKRAGLTAPFLEKVTVLILATAHHQPLKTEDERLIADIDLSIFGQPAEVFAEYERAIRSEYERVSESAYRTTRAAIIRQFLRRKSIYFTEHFQRKYEAAARANLQTALAVLVS